MKIFLLSFLTGLTFFVQAQDQNVGIGTTSPNSSAVLDVNSSTKGMLIPRLTTAQRKAISTPAMGLLVFDIDKGAVMFFDGHAWRALSFTDENKTDPQSRPSQQPAASAGFGSRVSISGDYAIVGAPRYGASGILNMGLAYIFNKTSNGWTQVARLAAKDSAEGAYFGGSVAISGDYAIVGSANKKVNNNTAQGKAYVFRRNGTAWQLDTALVKPNGVAFEDFGWAVGVCAYNTGGAGIAIGIPYSDATGQDRGEVYCYKRNTNNTWTFVQNIIPTDLANSDYYGTAIAMDTDYVAIGATGQDNITYAYADAGAAYIYAFGGGVWNFQQKLQGTTLRGQFGFSLSISSNKLAVGAPWATTYSNTSSSVFIYARTGNTWAMTTSLFVYNFEVVPNAGQIQPVSGSSISIANLTFGITVSLSGNTLLVGASGGSIYPNGGSSYYSDRVGSLYVYKNFSGNTFTRTKIIQSEFPSNGDLFGLSASISGNQYIIGNPNAIINGLVNAGNVYFGSE
jgi:FG-GAP repeat